jgi:hypothetical protein
VGAAFPKKIWVRLTPVVAKKMQRAIAYDVVELAAASID